MIQLQNIKGGEGGGGGGGGWSMHGLIGVYAIHYFVHKTLNITFDLIGKFHVHWQISGTFTLYP